jgi:CRP-like cAMP-binding protein
MFDASHGNLLQTQNQLLARLSLTSRKMLIAASEPFALSLSDVLSTPGKASQHVYFPIRGFISLVAIVADTPGVEVGMVGNEGMLGAERVLGVAKSPVHALVQGAGTAFRIEVDAFHRFLKANPATRRVLDRYLYVLMSQLVSSAACMRFHGIDTRLARWLLMSQDRAGSAHFHVTQDFLAFMLGVRRPGVSIAASALQRRGLIDYRRGDFTVVDRAGLEASACSCYATSIRIYAEVMPRISVR